MKTTMNSNKNTRISFQSILRDGLHKYLKDYQNKSIFTLQCV